MLHSPFAFLRDSAAVMAAAPASTPVTGLEVQACGDMHVANFGVFSGYLGKSDVFDDAMVRFAATYAEQTQHDYNAFAAAARAGEIEVASLPRD